MLRTIDALFTYIQLKIAFQVPAQAGRMNGYKCLYDRRITIHSIRNITYNGTPRFSRFRRLGQFPLFIWSPSPIVLLNQADFFSSSPSRSKPDEQVHRKHGFTQRNYNTGPATRLTLRHSSKDFVHDKTCSHGQ